MRNKHGARHNHLQNQDKCAMTIKPLWQCAECGDNHQYEDDAAECCRPPRPFQIYICPHCDAEFRHSPHLVEHLSNHDEEQEGYVPPPPTAAELETAGQKRLAL